MDEQKPTFARFWAQNKTNLIIGLVISLICCVVVGQMGLLFSTPVWVLIALICWCVRTGVLYFGWKRDNGNH